MLIPHVVIDEFKDESRPGSVWRLNWFGAVERDPIIASEYKLQIILTLVKPRATGNWHTETAVEQDVTRVAKVGAGQLPLLRLGSLWKDGELVHLRTGIDKNLTLEIPSGVPTYYAATDKVNGLSGLIPYNAHRVMGYGKNTKCIVLPYGNNPVGIILPVIELIRFYYACSTRLSKAVFNGDFIHNPSSIFDPDYTGMDGKNAVVCRRQDVCDDECWIIARVLNAEQAFEGVRRVNDSMIREFTNTRQAHPETIFPFIGHTTIRAKCKPVGFDRLLVLSIMSCTSIFPFNDLFVMADNDASQASAETDIPDENKTDIIREQNSGGEKEGCPLELVSDREPNKLSLPIRLESPGDSFIALYGKKIKKIEKDHCDYKSGQLRTVVKVLLEDYGTGDGNGNESNKGKADIARRHYEDTLPPSYSLLGELIEELNKFDGVVARFPSLTDGPGLVLAILTAPERKKQWSYIDRSKRQRRYFMIVEIIVNGQFFYLIEIERRDSSEGDCYCAEVITETGQQFKSQQIEIITAAITRSKGRVSNQTRLPPGIKRRIPGLKHTWSNVSKFASRVRGAIDEIQ